MSIKYSVEVECDECHNQLFEHEKIFCSECNNALLLKIKEHEQKIKDLEAVITNKQGGDFNVRTGDSG